MSDWNRVLILRRLRWPALLLLTGIIALLDQIGILSWDHAWPLYLILLGVMMLAERAAWPVDARNQQAAQGYVSGTQDSVPGQSAPPSVSGSAWTTSPPSAGDIGAEPFIQPHPPAPEDSGREDR